MRPLLSWMCALEHTSDAPVRVDASIHGRSVMGLIKNKGRAKGRDNRKQSVATELADVMFYRGIEHSLSF